MEPEKNNEDSQENKPVEKEVEEGKKKLVSVFWDVISFIIIVGLFEISWNNGLASLFCRLPKMNYSQATFVMAFLYIFSRFTFGGSILGKEGKMSE